MDLQGSMAGSASLLSTLWTARRSLVENQRGLPPDSPSWARIERIVHEIDELGAHVAGHPQSNPLNLNAGSELSFKRRTRRSRESPAHQRVVETRHMSGNALTEFAAAVRKKGRIGKYDIEHLEHEILSDGITSLEEAEILIALDREMPSLHFSWARFFIAAIAEFVVWQWGTAGYIDEAKSKWLVDAFGREGASDRGQRTLVRIAQEAECFDEAFFVSSRPAHQASGSTEQALAHAA